MELRLDHPREWRIEPRGDGGRRVVLDGVAVDVAPFLALPDEPRPWIEEVMGRNLPAGARLGELDAVEAQNALGWPMEVVAATVVDEQGTALERRLGAFYKFNEWVACALARGPRVEEARAELMAVFVTGRPRWQSATVVAAIAELWG